MRVLDLFCGAGGAAMGLHRAWPDAEIIGVDIKPQPRYPFTFVQGDAMEFSLKGFDFIWASPPCQRYCLLAFKNGNAEDHPDLIGPVRRRLCRSGSAWVIENVLGAKKQLRSPVLLCGTMFDLGIPEAQLWRHRLFESNFPTSVGHRCAHRGSPVGVYGGGGDFRRFGALTVTGHTGGRRKRGNLQQYNVRQRSAAMGIDWMTNQELSQAIPPAYSEYIARQFERRR